MYVFYFLQLENDLENYMRYKLQGVKKRLKKNVVPHIFECQKTKKTVPRQTGQKRRRLHEIADVLSPSTSSVPSYMQSGNSDEVTESQVYSSTGRLMVNQETQTDIVPLSAVMIDQCTQVKAEDLVPPVIRVHKSVQVKPVKPHFRSRAQNTDRVITKSQETSTETIEPLPATIRMFEPELPEFSDAETDLTAQEDSDDVYDDEEDLSADEEISDDDELKLSMRSNFVTLIQKHPRLLIGVPQHSYFLVSFLSKTTKCSELNILITLKKIRLNDSYAVLSLHFGMSISNIARIVKETSVRLANVLKDFIVWPEDEKIQENLPIAFRARFFKVVSIIDCFEVEIERPTNPKNQALTWSDYKKCNTLKYLISCTPDGLITFISEGYGGRASDTVIVKDCGYLERLSHGNHVMTDRGFKHMETSLNQVGCELVRPPSVATNVQSTKKEVVLSKQIASLRIHVERVIRRLREFKLIAPHACVDHHLICNFDNFVNIACGLVNLQDHLIK